jgi:methionine-rich copper-binding protein CopC
VRIGAAMGRAGLLLAVALAPAGCARKGAPSGGPPDIVPPRVLSAAPDSGTAGVALDAALSISFSEGMEPKSTGEAVSLAPRVDIRQRRWKGRQLSLVLEQPLRADQTYTLFLANTARDAHGNVLAAGRTIVFSTADSFPPGLIEGRIAARGFKAEGTYLWCYGGERAPDSTARDFDALGLADGSGHFRIPGLPVPARYRLWAFADLNRNRSFEPDKDVLAPADTVIELTAARPAVTGLEVEAVDPRAPGHVRGLVTDATGDSAGVLRVFAIFEDDTSRRIVADVDPKGAFDLELAPGKWRVGAWRDADQNRAWRMDIEPASEIKYFTVEPAAEFSDERLALKRWTQSP